jgi:hypothetical protein
VRHKTDLPLLIAEWQEPIDGLAACLRQEHVSLLREPNVLQAEYSGASS